LPSSLSAKDLSNGQTPVINFCPINKFNCHPKECDKDHSPELVLDNEN
jgi:hypothetical protein